jgi:HD-GYP domain-containing protein (c-di-GMP phosphodiesterase class II)
MHAPDVSSLTDTSEERTVFHPVPLATLRPNQGAHFDLYASMPTRAGQRYLLYKAAHLDLTERKRAELIEKGVKTLYVSEKDIGVYVEYVDRTEGEMMRSEQVSLEQKSVVLYQTTSSLMKSMFERPDSPALLKTNQTIVTHAVSVISSEPQMLRTIVSLFAMDYSLYTHSVNVATLGTGLLLGMGSDYAGGTTGKNLEERVRDVVMGFLLHDIGKSKVPSEVLRKSGVLSQWDAQQIEQHPVFGVELMQQHEEITPEALEVILGHHEKLNGSGYPRQLPAESLSLETRLCTIVDIFDALTSHRIYKPALTSYEAIRTMMQKMSHELDQEILHSLVSVLGPNQTKSFDGVNPSRFSELSR